MLVVVMKQAMAPKNINYHQSPHCNHGMLFISTAAKGGGGAGSFTVADEYRWGRRRVSHNCKPTNFLCTSIYSTPAQLKCNYSAVTGV